MANIKTAISIEKPIFEQMNILAKDLNILYKVPHGSTNNESPPNVLGIVDDFWFRYVADMGNAGPD